MKKYVDINTGKEYDEIPAGKVLPLIVNGKAVTEEAYNKYKELHPEQLQELVVVAKKKPKYKFKEALEIPVLSRRRMDSQRAHHKATDLAGSSMSTAAEFVDINTGRLGNIFRPTWWFGNIVRGHVGNPLDYSDDSWNNRGIFEVKALQDWYERHPYLAEGLNVLADAAVSYGVAKVVEPVEIRTGTETPLVRTRRISPTVEKHSHITPSEAHIRNLNGGLKLTYKGKDAFGLNIYSLRKAWFPNNPTVALRRIIDNAKNKGYRVVTHPNLLGIALENKARNIVISDLGETGRGQVGWTIGRWGLPRPVIVDGAFETIPEFNVAMLKNGGKLIKNRYGNI